MSGPSPKQKKFAPPSLERAKCVWCGHEGRKDNLRKHHDQKHPGKEFKWKQILLDGQSSLYSHFPGKAERVEPSNKESEVDKVIIELPSEGFENIDHDNIEKDQPRKRQRTEDVRVDISTLVEAPKHTTIDDENNAQINPSESVAGQIVNEVKREISNTVTEFKYSLTQMMESFAKQFTLREKDITDEDIDEKGDAVTDDSELNSSSIFSCKDAGQLLKLLPEISFEYDEESETITCVLCNQSSVPNIRVRDSKVGVFSLDMSVYRSKVELEPNKQPRMFSNLKHSMVKHVQESQIHRGLKEESIKQQNETRMRQCRNEKIGLTLFKIRYNGIMHGSSYQNFEEDVLTAHLNGVDTGDINNGCDFAKDLTRNIVDVMKEKLAENLSKDLAATARKRPVGLVSDKITPNKRTGHITALILPVPENPLTEKFLNPIMLDLPPVTDHTADGLSDQMLGLMRGAGCEDSQLEGIGVDGQYIKMGAIKKLISKLNVEGFTEGQLANWVFETWEPAHNLNKADEEIRKLAIFDWLVRLTNEVGDITRILGIGKGLEQSKEAAFELEKQLYKLQAYSVTRFVAHV